MPQRKRTDAGTFAEKGTLDDVREVFDEVRGPVVTSSDVADALGCTTEAARQKLRRLDDQGRVEKRKTGRVIVYWRAEDTANGDRDGFDVEDLNGDAETTLADTDAESPREPVETPPDTSPADDAADTGTPEIDDALDGWEPDTEANPQTARAQTRRAAEHLQEVGEFQRASELRDALADDSTLSPQVWWEHHARPGLNHVADHGLVEYVRDRGYRWTGPDPVEDADGGVYDPTEEF